MTESVNTKLTTSNNLIYHFTNSDFPAAISTADRVTLHYQHASVGVIRVTDYPRASWEYQSKPG